jgi:hypothetical protein
VERQKLVHARTTRDVSASAFHVCAGSPPYWRRRGALMPTDRTRQDTLVRIASCASRHAVRLRSRVGCPVLVWGLWRCCGAAFRCVGGCETAAQGAAWPGPRPCRTGLDVSIICRCKLMGVRCYNHVMSRLSTVGSINLARSQPTF